MEELFFWIVILDDYIFVDEKYDIDVIVYGLYWYKIIYVLLLIENIVYYKLFISVNLFIM